MIDDSDFIFAQSLREKKCFCWCHTNTLGTILRRFPLETDLIIICQNENTVQRNGHISFQSFSKRITYFKIKLRRTKRLEIIIIYQYYPPPSWKLYLWRNNLFLKEGHTYPIASWNGSKSFISEVCFTKGRLCVYPHLKGLVSIWYPKIFLQQTGILLPQQILSPHPLPNILPQ